MDMMGSMTMPEVVVAAIIVLVVVCVGIFVAVRVAGGRQVERDQHGDGRRRRRRGAGDDPAGPRH